MSYMTYMSYMIYMIHSIFDIYDTYASDTWCPLGLIIYCFVYNIYTYINRSFNYQARGPSRVGRGWWRKPVLRVSARRVAACCSVLQFDAVCCFASECVAVVLPSRECVAVSWRQKSWWWRKSVLHVIAQRVAAWWQLELNRRTLCLFLIFDVRNESIYNRYFGAEWILKSKSAPLCVSRQVTTVSNESICNWF